MGTVETAPLGGSMITKTEAQVQLASIVTPLNIKQSSGSKKVTLSEFVKLVYVPVPPSKMEIFDGLRNF